MDRYPKFVDREFEFFREEFPCPSDRLYFEVVTEREVTEHFEECMVTRRSADVLNVTRTNAFLARRDTRMRRFHFARKERFERSHTRTNHQKSRIIFRNERVARQYQMIFALEKF